MDNIRILRQIYDDCEAERAMHYDKLSRTLNNPDLSSNPVDNARCLIEEISRLERSQEVAVGFMTQIQEDIAKAQQKQHSQEKELKEELEDDGMGEEDEK